MNFPEKSSCYPLFKNVFFETPIHRSESADLFKNILLELRSTARKARIVSAPAALICPKIKRGKDPWSFSPLGSPFSLRNRRSSLPPLVGPAAVRRTKARPKRLNGLFYLPDLILGRSTGQIRRMGGRKARQKRQTYSIRWFY